MTHSTPSTVVMCSTWVSPTFPHNLQVQFGTVGFLDITTDGPTGPRAEASVWRLNETGIEPFDWDTWGRPW